MPTTINFQELRLNILLSPMHGCKFSHEFLWQNLPGNKKTIGTKMPGLANLKRSVIFKHFHFKFPIFKLGISRLKDKDEHYLHCNYNYCVTSHSFI